ncbi:hypothetical protein D3C85_864080 [compost metagenome]
MQDGYQGLGRGRGVAGRLHHHRIAEGQGRRRLPGRDGDGEVPRRDQAIDADRLAIGLDLYPRTGRGQVLAMQAQGLASEILEDAGGAGRLADALGQGLALFARQQTADRLAALHQQAPSPIQHVRAHLGRGVGPAVKGGRGRRHGFIHLGRAAAGRQGHDFARVGRVQALDLARAPALAIDPVRQFDGSGHGLFSEWGRKVGVRLKGPEPGSGRKAPWACARRVPGCGRGRRNGAGTAGAPPGRRRRRTGPRRGRRSTRRRPRP